MVCRGISSVSKKKERTKVGVEKQWGGKSDGKIQIKKIYAEKLEKMLIEVSEKCKRKCMRLSKSNTK